MDPMAWVLYNRRRTTGVKIEELVANTATTEDAAFEIVETNLDVDIKALEQKKVVVKKKKLVGLLKRNGL